MLLLVVSLLEPLLSPTFSFLTKVSLSHLLLVLEVCNVQSTFYFRKSYAANLLAMSDLTLDLSFKVKLGWVNIKVPVSCLFLVLDVRNVQTTFRKPYAVNRLVMSDLTLDHSFKVKLWWLSISVPISRILLVLDVSNVQSTFRRPYAANLLAMSNLTLDLSFKVKTGAGQDKNASISLIIGSRGFQYTVNL